MYRERDFSNWNVNRKIALILFKSRKHCELINKKTSKFIMRAAW